MSISESSSWKGDDNADEENEIQINEGEDELPYFESLDSKESIPDFGEFEGSRNPNGEREGWGRSDYPNGDIFEGEYFRGKRNGYGLYKYFNRTYYEGSWKDGKREGYGVFQYGDDSRYSGYWENEMRHGEGIYQYANGDIYTGNWAESMRYGQGCYHYKRSGQEYQGAWKDGKRHGEGSIYFGPFKYTGYFRNNLPTGNGKMIFHYGCQQRGRFLRKRPGSDELEGGLILKLEEEQTEQVEEEEVAISEESIPKVSDIQISERSFDEAEGEEIGGRPRRSTKGKAASIKPTESRAGEALSKLSNQFEDEEEVEWEEGMVLIWTGFPLEITTIDSDIAEDYVEVIQGIRDKVFRMGLERPPDRFKWFADKIKDDFMEKMQLELEEKEKKLKNRG